MNELLTVTEAWNGRDAQRSCGLCVCMGDGFGGRLKLSQGMSASPVENFTVFCECDGSGAAAK
jgi:hypothetical protein